MKPNIYCAIYTRKSTSEGLDSDFTSLDNQREAAINYINSQKGEGWVALPDKYDDGGYTGGNTDRPALQRLIADIKESKVNCVVVYKVDRLSRSLLDFVQLLQLFDKNNVTFVSVTQAFNTNNSMGRLTLNILLSFAQFEREIISERVKDKMGAGRKKGKWLGGPPILGYDIIDHKLVVNQKEVPMVHEVFNSYLKNKSLLKATMELNEKGLKTKQFTSLTGIFHGGIKFKKTSLQLILKNPLYIGKIRYDGVLYPGLHEPIISEATFQRVSDMLKDNRYERLERKNVKFVGLLNHILRCKSCDSIMFHTYSTRKNKRKYRYYVCMNAQKRGYQECPTRAVSAHEIESAVIESLKSLGKGDQKLKESLIVNSPIWEELFPQEKRHALHLMLKDAYYDGITGKLKLHLNESGVKLLYRMQEGLPKNE